MQMPAETPTWRKAFDRAVKMHKGSKDSSSKVGVFWCEGHERWEMHLKFPGGQRALRSVGRG